MPRQRSSARAPSRPTVSAPAPQQRRPATTMAAPPPQQHAPTAMAPPQQVSQGPGLFGQMASTAAYVAFRSFAFILLALAACHPSRSRLD